jgi:tetratricopeptide (TPR) repeat protein
MLNETPSIIFKRIKKLINSGKLEQAKEDLQPLITEYSDDYRVFLMLGFIYHREGRFPRAIKNYEKALELNDRDFDSSINLSIIYNDLGKYKLGAEYYKKAVQNVDKLSSEEIGKKEEIDDMFSKQHLSLGELYLRYNRPNEALNEFRKAKSLYDKNINIDLNISETFFRLKKRKEAIKILQDIKLKKPNFYEARVKLGHLKFLEGDIGSAVEEWEEIVKEDPQHVQARMYLKMAEEESILP